MTDLQHRNLVRLMGINLCETDQTPVVSLVTEFMSKVGNEFHLRTIDVLVFMY